MIDIGRWCAGDLHRHIDPGKDGAMAVIYSGSEIRIHPFSHKAYQFYLEEMYEADMPAACCLERVGARPGQGVTSMFRFGENYGFIQGLLAAYAIPYELVTPQKWKREFQITGDKNSAVDVCRRLFPGVSLRRTERCKKDHDGMAEALLMAEYVKRKLGGSRTDRV